MRSRKPAAATRRGQRARNPTKFGLGDSARVKDRAPADYEGRRGLITEIGPGESEYRVEFEDGRRPTTGYLPSHWLDPVKSPS